MPRFGITVEGRVSSWHSIGPAQTSWTPFRLIPSTRSKYCYIVYSALSIPIRLLFSLISSSSEVITPISRESSARSMWITPSPALTAAFAEIGKIYARRVQIDKTTKTLLKDLKRRFPRSIKLAIGMKNKIRHLFKEQEDCHIMVDDICHHPNYLLSSKLRSLRIQTFIYQRIPTQQLICKAQS
ncbi:uncharacterized protein FTJAE_3412 [Fusarium tjaetaba]|uniref:Uncharacterized protein n=1 Tax=Fusarium tjaetaba TaxID=1567544 RepID=A0A8H5S1F2_9HYPO|nr:uncharacterized protein FTJAE_3412 [Fusarium tjaetaba]KAF5642870.1 hypothetical protein FTJAE_3412 [Fusarium tjaetaba]